MEATASDVMLLLVIVVAEKTRATEIPFNGKPT
jgi:hypothetical protein